MYISTREIIIKKNAEAKEIWVPTLVSGEIAGNFMSAGALKLVWAMNEGQLRLIILSRFAKDMLSVKMWSFTATKAGRIWWWNDAIDGELNAHGKSGVIVISGWYDDDGIFALQRHGMTSFICPISLG